MEAARVNVMLVIFGILVLDYAFLVELIVTIVSIAVFVSNVWLVLWWKVMEFVGCLAWLVVLEMELAISVLTVPKAAILVTIV